MFHFLKNYNLNTFPNPFLHNLNYSIFTKIILKKYFLKLTSRLSIFPGFISLVESNDSNDNVDIVSSTRYCLT